MDPKLKTPFEQLVAGLEGLSKYVEALPESLSKDATDEQKKEVARQMVETDVVKKTKEAKEALSKISAAFRNL
jgi:hypothetical protein